MKSRNIRILSLVVLLSVMLLFFNTHMIDLRQTISQMSSGYFPESLEGIMAVSTNGNITLQRQNTTQLITIINVCPNPHESLDANKTAKFSNVSTDMTPPSDKTMNHLSVDLGTGGLWTPKDCKAKHSVAIIVPFRDREDHLKIFLYHMHHFLQKQQLQYRIYVIEMDDKARFNRALLMNVGYVNARKDQPFDCYVFHDVDLLPEILENYYTCRDKPVHMSSAESKFGYRPAYATYFGGVTAFTEEQIQGINGFPNKYFGWGGEDDDIAARVHDKYKNFIRISDKIGRYNQIPHKKNTQNPKNVQLLGEWKKRLVSDGLNNLNYTIISHKYTPLYTWLLVSVDQELILKNR